MAQPLVLSIDGGGIRCLIPALVLADLQRRIAESGRKVPLYRHVGMVAGSGIGALLAAALAYPNSVGGGKPVADPRLILDYFEAASRLFPNRIESASGHMRHDSTLFETLLKQWFGAEMLVADAQCHVVYPAFDLASRAPMMIADTDAVTSKFYLWQALRAMLAVPPYVSPALVENRAVRRRRGTPLIPVVGGGRYAADPALAAYAEASRLGWQDQGFTVLSLGTGLDASPIPFLNVQSASSTEITDVTDQLMECADTLHCPISSHMNTLMNGEARGFDGVSTRIGAEGGADLSYFRINGPLGAASAAVDDLSPGNIAGLKADAARIIAAHGPVLDEIVARLPRDGAVRTPRPNAAA